jgi:hypothetical protein
MKVQSGLGRTNPCYVEGTMYVNHAVCACCNSERAQEEKGPGEGHPEDVMFPVSNHPDIKESERPFGSEDGLGRSGVYRPKLESAKNWSVGVFYQQTIALYKRQQRRINNGVVGWGVAHDQIPPRRDKPDYEIPLCVASWQFHLKAEAAEHPFNRRIHHLHLSPTPFTERLRLFHNPSKV